MPLTNPHARPHQARSSRLKSIAANCLAGLSVSAAVAVIGLFSAQTGTYAQTPPSAEFSAQVTVNGQAVGSWPILDRDGVLYASTQAFEHWQVRRRPNAQGISHQHQTWFALTSVRGSEATFDQKAKTLALRFDAQTMTGKPVVVAAAVAGVVAGGVTAPIEPKPNFDSAPTVRRALPLDVKINGAPSGSWVLLDAGGILHATEDAIEQWRVNRKDGTPSISHRGQQWYPLTSIAGYQFRLNLAEQSVDLVFSSTAFAATRLTTEVQERVALSPIAAALFLNYDLNFNENRFLGGGANVTTRDLGALTELGLSGSWGVLSSGFVGRNLLGSNSSEKRSVKRLETTFTRDFPDSNLTVRVGDSATRTGVGTRSTYFGGLQLSRNFGLSPGFISQPLPTIKGTSNAPSTVELYVNDVLRQTSNVPTGPFAIDNFPLLTGSGQVRMVVRDVLGRETVLVQPFFSHSSLLEAGLTDWSTELGSVRQDLGVENAKYGAVFASGLWRRGLSKEITAEVSGQVGRDTQTLGAGINAALPGQVLGYASLALSTDRTAGQGSEATVGLEYNNLRHGFATRWVCATQSYHPLGQQAGSFANRSEAAFNYSYASQTMGSLGVGLATINTFTQGTIVTTSANYGLKLGERASISISATRAAGSGVAKPSTAVGMSLSVPFDNGLSSSSTVNHRSGQTDAYTSFSKGLKSDTGLGWRALAGRRANQTYGEAGAYWQVDKALATADVSASSQQQNLRLGLQSAVVLIDGQLFTTRRVQDSFAVVEVPGYADVGVGFQGSNSTKTNANGAAFLPRLQPYQRNSIRLDPTELPIGAEIDNIEQVVVPSARSGVKVSFPVRSGRSALIKIVLRDGLEAPAGADVELVGDTKEFFVARRGETFVTGLQSNNTIRLKYGGASCTFDVKLPDAAKIDGIERIGPIVCKGVTR